MCAARPSWPGQERAVIVSGNARQEPDGHEPDVRFTLANERTFLAWSRTCLALIAAGLAITQLLPPFPGVSWGRSVIGTPLIVLGGTVSVLSYLEWQRYQRELRLGAPLTRSRLPVIIAGAIAAVAALAGAVELYSLAAR
jgi:putative membrane protein